MLNKAGLALAAADSKEAAADAASAASYFECR